MSDWPADVAPPLTIWTGSKYSMGTGSRDLTGSTPTWASISWTTANLAQYIPVVLPFRYPVRRFFIYNFANLNGNVEFGIYSEDFAKVASSGNITQANLSNLQFATVDVLLDPGLYFFALASNSTTSTFAALALGTAARERELGMLEQATAFPLPAIATPTAVTTARVPLIGMTWHPSLPI